MTPYWILTFLVPDSFPYPFFFSLAFFIRLPPISLLCLFSICFLPSLFFYYLPISSPTSSPFIFLASYFICVPFRPLLYYSGTSPPIPLHLSLVPRFCVPPSPHPFQFRYYLLFHCSSLVICFLFFPVLQSTLLCSFCLPAVHLVI